MTKPLNSRRRIVVTGMGCLSPIGNNLQETWQAMLEGRNGIGRITHFDPSELNCQIAGEVKNFNPDDFINKKESKRMDRVIQLAVSAAKMALEDSGLTVDDNNRHRVGVSVGSGIGGMTTYEQQFLVMIEKGPNKISPFFIPMMIPNMASGQISINFGLCGPSFSVVSACATSVNCIGSAVDTILAGRGDVMPLDQTPVQDHRAEAFAVGLFQRGDDFRGGAQLGGLGREGVVAVGQLHRVHHRLAVEAHDAGCDDTVDRFHDGAEVVGN